MRRPGSLLARQVILAMWWFHLSNIVDILCGKQLLPVTMMLTTITARNATSLHQCNQVTLQRCQITCGERLESLLPIFILSCYWLFKATCAFYLLILLHLIFFCRFFYENIWREWDEDDDGDYSYVDRHLETRLQLYHDIQGGNLPKDLIKKYRGNVTINNNIIIIIITK